MAASVIGEAAVRVRADTTGFGHEVKQGVTGALKSVALAGGALFAAIGVGRFFKGAFAEAQESIKVTRQVNAVIKSTGKVAHVSAKQVDELSSTLSDVAGVDDEVIQRGAALLLTFTNVRNEVGKGNQIFDQAITAATDLSAALGQDMQSSVIQLGKALNDPIRGVTALRRVGVSFTEQQQNQIKALVKSNDLLGAQRLILGELNKEFGGAAAALATPWDRMKVALQNLQEGIGIGLMPVLNQFATFLSSTLVPFIINTVVPKIVELAQDFGKIVTAVGPAAVGAVKAFFEGFDGPEADKASKRVKGLKDDGIRLDDVIKEFGRVMREDVNPVLETFGELVGGNNKPVNDFADAIFKVGEKVDRVKEKLGFLGDFMQFQFFPVIGLMDKRFRESLGNILDFVGETLGKIQRFFKRFGERFTKPVEDALSGLPGIIQGAVEGFGNLLVDAGQQLIEGLIRGIWSQGGHLVRSLKKFVKDHIPKPIRDVLGISSPSKLFAQFGRQTIEGFIVGLEGEQKNLTAALRRTAGTIDLGLGPRDVNFGTLAASSAPQPVAAAPVFNITTTQQDARVLANEISWRWEREARR